MPPLLETFVTYSSGTCPSCRPGKALRVGRPAFKGREVWSLHRSKSPETRTRPRAGRERALTRSEQGSRAQERGQADRHLQGQSGWVADVQGLGSGVPSWRRSSDKEGRGTRVASGKRSARARWAGNPGAAAERRARAPRGGVRRREEEASGPCSPAGRASPRQSLAAAAATGGGARLVGQRRRWRGELQEERLRAGRRQKDRRAPPPPALGRCSPPPATAPTLRWTPRAATRASCRAPATPSCRQT